MTGLIQEYIIRNYTMAEERRLISVEMIFIVREYKGDEEIVRQG
jgi:hypothetical protein